MVRRIVVADNEASADDAASSDDSDQDDQEDNDVAREEVASHQAAAKLKLGVKLKDKLAGVCKVCGKKGHSAGFVGSVYVDCINKPCYLCKQPGHTTATCPHRVAPGHATAASGPALVEHNLLRVVLGREASGHAPIQRVRTQAPEYQVDAAILRLHTRRVCCLEFHPTHDRLVVSADKKGGIAVWDMDKVHERTVYRDLHRYTVNTMQFIPWFGDGNCLATASCDGTSKVVDVEVGTATGLLDLNPNGYTTEKEWRMVYGADVSQHLHAIVVGDSDGLVHILDPRTPGAVSSLQLHKKGNKVVSIAVHPMEPRLVLTAGNDHTARLFDLRQLSNRDAGKLGASISKAQDASANGSGQSPEAGQSAGAKANTGQDSQAAPAAAGASSSQASKVASPASAPTSGGKVSGGKAAATGRGARAGPGKQAAAHPAELSVLHHPRVVNSAVFSPVTGHKLLTTCQDNRLRVWDHVAISPSGTPPDHEHVHSHDFNRYLTPFKGEWDPKDLTESRVVIGRYISDDYDGVALHPVDIIDITSGALLAALVDHNLTTISPVNKPHPRRDVIVSGSSRSLYLWARAHNDPDELGGVASPQGAGTSSGAGPSQQQQLRDVIQRAARSSKYTFFDAEPETKGKKGAGAASKTKAKPSGSTAKRKKPPREDDEDEDD